MKKLLIASIVLCCASTVEARGRRSQQYVPQAQFSVPAQPMPNPDPKISALPDT